MHVWKLQWKVEHLIIVTDNCYKTIIIFKNYAFMFIAINTKQDEANILCGIL